MNAWSTGRSSAGATRLLRAAAFALGCAVFPSFSGAYDAKDCDQDEVASLALRACSSMLEKSGLSEADKVRFLTRRGNAWITEEEPNEAIKDFTHALEIAAGNKDALRGRARANVAIGKHEDAAADLSTLIGTADVSTEIEPLFFDRAASLAASGKTDAALADYEKILAASPKNIKARIGRARIYASLKDREKALAEFDAALQVDAKEPSIFLARAEAAETWGDVAAAITDYKTFIQLNNRQGWVAVRALRRLGAE